MKKPTTCVTGCLGFIGSALTRRLISDGHFVIGVDNLSSGFQEYYPHGHAASFQLISNDYASRQVIDRLADDDIDTVVHLAATPRVSYSVAHPVETHDNNVTKLVRLLDACRGHIRRFVFASSSSVYGGANELPTPETHPLSPKSPYALQKMIGEQYLVQYSMHYGLDSVALRFFNVFGPGATGFSSYATAVAGWMTSIKEGRPMRSDGDGTQTRDICYIDNTVDGIVAAINRPEAYTHDAAFNIASGARVSNNDILAYLTERYPQATHYDVPTRAGDVAHTHADISKARLLLGYEPRVSQMDGIARTCDWFDNNWDFIQRLGYRKV